MSEFHRFTKKKELLTASTTVLNTAIALPFFFSDNSNDSILPIGSNRSFSSSFVKSYFLRFHLILSAQSNSVSSGKPKRMICISPI
jgi:hypothetical protein